VRAVVTGRALVIVGVLVALIGGGCGDDDDGDSPSTASLEGLIPPPSAFGPLDVQREFTWDNPFDYVIQGLLLPQATAPSEAFEEMEDAGFSAGAGQELANADNPPVIVSVAAFGSEEEATEVQEYLHEQDLQQPCFAECTVDPQEFEVSDPSEATAVHYVPIEDQSDPRAFPPPDGYAAEFVVGSQVFYVHTEGVAEEDFLKGLQAFYDHASESGSAS
jgi:hypothetical protein